MTVCRVRHITKVCYVSSHPSFTAIQACRICVIQNRWYVKVFPSVGIYLSYITEMEKVDVEVLPLYIQTRQINVDGHYCA